MKYILATTATSPTSGWWGNAMGVNNLLSLRMQLGRTGLMVGYRLDLRTFHANHLKTQQLRNAFVIGIIP